MRSTLLTELHVPFVSVVQKQRHSSKGKRTPPIELEQHQTTRRIRSKDGQRPHDGNLLSPSHTHPHFPSLPVGSRAETAFARTVEDQRNANSSEQTPDREARTRHRRTEEDPRANSRPAKGAPRSGRATRRSGIDPLRSPRGEETLESRTRPSRCIARAGPRSIGIHHPDIDERSEHREETTGQRSGHLSHQTNDHRKSTGHDSEAQRRS